MHKLFLKIAVLLGALAVMLGAFGAHALKKMLTQEGISTFETAVRYQFYHVFALLFCSIIYKYYPTKWMLYAGNSFIAGIILFSGSLYVLTFFAIVGSPIKWVGAITPFGGLAFIIGWLCLFIAAKKVN